MAHRELTNEQDRLDVLEYRNAATENQPFLCSKHNEQIRLHADANAPTVSLTGCCDEGFDAFLNHVRGAVGYIRALRTEPDYE